MLLGSGAEVILKYLKMFGPSEEKIEVIYDTHVPAYGYGKNHGWTRIIRIAHELVPHALSLVDNSPSYSVDLQVS